MSGFVISIHAPPRGATYFWHVSACLSQFQFTPLREGRRNLDKRARRVKNFNSRPSARGDSASRQCRASGSFQFTPLREGRHNGTYLDTRDIRISIHAPPRGATNHRTKIYIHFNISIHVPPRGATGQAATRKRRDDISIHAPPRGATRGGANRGADVQGFQFTPLREGRPDSHGGIGRGAVFQFTPLREGRPHQRSAGAGRSYFNSRPSARGDLLRRNQRRPAGDFNSRPSARGDSKRYAISANLLFNPYKSAWLNNRATQFVEIILVIFHRIIA